MNFMKGNWDLLLTEFRRLGGIADNVYQNEGEYGRGIFPFNPNLKTKIFTPSKLLVKKDDIDLENNKLRIKQDKEYSEEIRNFFNFYQDNFSWGSGGRKTTESFEKGLSLFNPNLKELIKTYALVDIDQRHEEEWESVLKTQFLNARKVKFRNNNVIAPVWELVNHKVRSLSFISNNEGISTPNYPASNSEIRFSYNNSSSLNKFFSYGFFSGETIVFSLPFSQKIPDQDIYISCNGMSLKDDSMKIKRSHNKIILEGLPIADLNNPRLPYEYFDELLRRIGNHYISKDLLSRILQFNIFIRNQIIEESDLINNEVSKTLSKVMRYEISLISSNN